ncbi:Uncharacterised protein [Clostridioides difficile]|nr:Uncharacterised protein [Clostridioides difficile]
MFALPQGKPLIGSILSIIIDTEILSQRLVATNVGISNEGIINPGYKLMLSIKFKEKIRYSAKDCEESINVLRLESEIYSFSISLPCKINGIDTCELERRNKIEVIPYIEDIYTELIDPCNILQSITFFLHGIVK